MDKTGQKFTLLSFCVIVKSQYLVGEMFWKFYRLPFNIAHPYPDIHHAPTSTGGVIDACDIGVVLPWFDNDLTF